MIYHATIDSLSRLRSLALVAVCYLRTVDTEEDSDQNVRDCVFTVHCVHCYLVTRHLPPATPTAALDAGLVLWQTASIDHPLPFNTKGAA